MVHDFIGIKVRIMWLYGVGVWFFFDTGIYVGMNSEGCQLCYVGREKYFCTT